MSLYYGVMTRRWKKKTATTNAVTCLSDPITVLSKHILATLDIPGEYRKILTSTEGFPAL